MNKLAKFGTIVFAIGTVVSISACATATTDVPLEGTSWMLELPPNSGCEVPPTLEFTKGKVHGELGCNTFFADVVINGKEITFDHAGLTRKMCAKAFMQVEQQMLTALNATKTYSVSANSLKFFDASGKEVLHLVPEKAGACE